MKDRLLYYDQMKGVAILFVVIGHVFLFSYGNSNNSVDSMLTIFHMPVFFYISGYLAYKSIPTMKEWCARLWKKTHSLIFPYVVFAGLWCFFRDKDFLHLLSIGGSEYWFMYVLFLLTVFFMFFELLIKHIKNSVLYVVAWLMPYTILIYIQRRYGEIGGGVFAINQLVAFYRFYLLGFLCKKYMSINELVFNNKYVYGVCFMAFFARWYWSEGCNMLISFMGITGAIIILQNFFNKSVNSESRLMKMLAYIGQNSLEIYLLQYFFLPDLSEIVGPYMDVQNGFIWQLSLAFLLTVPITAACLFVGTIIKTNKLLSWIMLGK